MPVIAETGAGINFFLYCVMPKFAKISFEQNNIVFEKSDLTPNFAKF